MDDDLLFRNKFVSDLKVPNTYDVKNKNKEAAFRQYIERKKDIVGLNDEDTDIFEEHIMSTNPLVVSKDGTLNKQRHVIERRYIYNINSKTRQITKEDYVEKEVVTGEYVKVTTNNFGEIVYETIDIDELNTEYNALDIPNSVVNPFSMIGNDMYFKSFLYRTPDEYIIDLPLMHTNVKSVRLLSSVIPCTTTNINRYNNHVMIDILFGSAQILENPDFDIVFGTLIMKIPYGNYSVDQVCSEIASLVNTFYYNKYVNNTGNSLYDKANMLTASSFSYTYNAITGELYFSLAQPSNQPTIETLVMVDPIVYENTIKYDPGTGYSTVQFPLKEYTNFLTYTRTIAAAMNYDSCGYVLGSYVEQFIILEKGGNVYLSSLFNSFNLDMTASYENIRASLNLGASGTKSSTFGTLFAVDVTAGYNAFVNYNSTGASDVIFTVGTTTYTSSIGSVFFTNYTAFITAVVDAMNHTTFGYPAGNFVFSTQQQMKFNDTTYVYDIMERYYIIGDFDFTFQCATPPGTVMNPLLTAEIFGSAPGADVGSTVNSILISAGSPGFPYTPTATTEIYFTFNSVAYIAYIPAVNYSDYDTFITAVVNAMNLTCKNGFFAFDREETSPEVYEYYLYAANNFTMEFSSMPAIGSVMVHPPTDTDITTTSFRLELTGGYNAFVNPYNAYAVDYSNFYLNIRQKVPDPPFDDDPGSTNITVQVPLIAGTYSDINTLMTHIISQLNTTVTGATWLKPTTSVTFSYSIEDDKITIQITSTPADTYEFNIDGSLMVALASFLGILITVPTTYTTSYTTPYKYGNRLRFKMSFENNPDVSEDDQLWYMLGFRSNNSLTYVDIPWSNIFDYGNDNYYFSSTSFVNAFIPSRSTETTPDIEDKRPYRLPSMSKTNYVYLQINNYENMYDPSVPNEKIYTKILLSEDYGKFAYDTFVDNPYVLSTTDSRLDRLQIKFIDKNANPVDFNNIDHTLTIEIVEYSDRLNANDYNTRRGYNEHSSFPDALGLGYGK
ncbi:hypothetical protein N9064_00785 [bacterium]|nr:hypothetical protein [bacterium]